MTQISFGLFWFSFRVIRVFRGSLEKPNHEAREIHEAALRKSASSAVKILDSIALQFTLNNLLPVIEDSLQLSRDDKMREIAERLER